MDWEEQEGGKVTLPSKTLNKVQKLTNNGSVVQILCYTKPTLFVSQNKQQVIALLFVFVYIKSEIRHRQASTDTVISYADDLRSSPDWSHHVVGLPVWLEMRFYMTTSGSD